MNVFPGLKRGFKKLNECISGVKKGFKEVK